MEAFKIYHWLRSSTVEARLKGYLKDMGADEGEMVHGFRSGCAIMLALKGAALSEIMDGPCWLVASTYCGLSPVCQSP